MLARQKKRAFLVKISLNKIVTSALIVVFLVGGSLLLWTASLKIPDFGAFETRKISQSTKIYDRTGKVVLFDIHQNVKRTIIPFADIPRHLKNATVAIEDSEFYQHLGIKPTAILRAVLVNLGSGELKQGGSTITQQVVKNSILNNDKSFTRKLKEAILALKIERILSKEEILSLYLNEIPYGGNIYGIEEASQRFFGKDAKDLSLTESAYLAALPKAPSFYSPYGKNKQKLDERKNVVLNRMLELGFINQQETEIALREKVVFLSQDDGNIKAPHFVTFVKQYLESKYGQDKLENGGLKVITTLDWNLEQKAEETLKRIGAENEEKFNAKNAALVAVDPKTGQVLTMVGSRDYFDVENEGNFNVAIAHRQPGSSFKPFVYATAFNKGYTPDTVVFDLQTQFQSNCGQDGLPLDKTTDPDVCYMPQNYDSKFRGPMTLREALAQSINIPAIKTLYLAGIKDSIETARNMGVQGLEDANRYGLTLVLGGGEVSLLDMTSAYSVFANDGIRNPYTTILKVEDSQGNVLEEFKPQPRRVLPENSARMISDILSDNEARAPIFGRNTLFSFPGRKVAAKTGTTNDFRDAWVIGFAPNLVVGAWAGNNDNSPMDQKIAGLIITPMWHEVMAEAFKNLPVENFQRYTPANPDSLKPVMKGFWQGGKEYKIDKISGKLATEYTPKELIGTKVVNQVHSILYWVDKNDPLGPKPIVPEFDSQFNLWEGPVRKWAIEQGLTDQSDNSIPTATDDVHKPEYAPKITITSPNIDQTYNDFEKININFLTSSKYAVVQADFFVNDDYLGSSKNKPFNFSFEPNKLQNISDNNEIRIVVYDEVRNKSESAISFKLKLSND